MSATGKIISVVVTKEYRDSLIGPTGGITLRALKLLGEAMERISGWKDRCIGNNVLIDQGDLLAEQKIVEDKRCGIWPAKRPKHTRVPKVNQRTERGFTIDEIKNIRACSKAGIPFRKIAGRYKCSRELIARVVHGSDFIINERNMPTIDQHEATNPTTGELALVK